MTQIKEYVVYRTPIGTILLDWNNNLWTYGYPAFTKSVCTEIERGTCEGGPALPKFYAELREKYDDAELKLGKEEIGKRYREWKIAYMTGHHSILRVDYVEQLLREEKLWKSGESDTFTAELSGKEWEFTLRKEEDAECAPFKFSLEGTVAGTNESWRRRYTGMAAALLHVMNGLNENANIENRYKCIEDWLKEAKA